MPTFLPQTPLAVLSTISLVFGLLPHPPLLNVSRSHPSTTLESSRWTTPCSSGNTVTFHQTNGDHSAPTHPGLHPLGIVMVLPSRAPLQVVHRLNQLPPPLVASEPGLAQGPPGRPRSSASLHPVLNPALVSNTGWDRANVQ